MAKPNDRFTLTRDSQSSHRDEHRYLMCDGERLASINQGDRATYYASQKPEFRQNVDAIIADILAKEKIAGQEIQRRRDAESNADDERRVFAAERALAKGMGHSLPKLDTTPINPAALED